MEHVIGDFFVLDMIVYQCREGFKCSRCAFFNKGEYVCTDWRSKTGECGNRTRTDGKHVYFVQVGEVDAPFVITKDMLP